MRLRVPPPPLSRFVQLLWLRLLIRTLDFYQTAFGATQGMRYIDTDGKIGNAELHIGAAGLMLADSCPDMETLGVRPPSEVLPSTLF